MKDTILEDIAKYKAPTKVPPIAVLGFQLYEEAGFKMTEASVEVLRAALAVYEDDLKALTDANIGLGVFALYLRDTRKDTEAAEQIAKLIKETAPQYTAIGERVVNALKDLQSSAVNLLARFSNQDQSAQTRAPKFGEESPKGTLPLKELKPVRNMPQRPSVTKPKK